MVMLPTDEKGILKPKHAPLKFVMLHNSPPQVSWLAYKVFGSGIDVFKMSVMSVTVSPISSKNISAF